MIIEIFYVDLINVNMIIYIMHLPINKTAGFLCYNCLLLQSLQFHYSFYICNITASFV